MEDQEAYVFVNKIKWIVISIFIILIIGIISIFIYNFWKVKNVNTNLKDDGFTENAKNIYSKSNTEDNKTTSYLYISDEDKFSKTISLQDVKTGETIDLTYQNGNIEIIYSYFNVQRGGITEKASYNNSDFNCSITKNSGKYKSNCDYLLKEAKAFKKEAEKYVKKMNS